ncbi:hypothetical protein JF539_25990 [Labrenzia aggregata]|uniref:Uncharacterized protein n=2 Tax=Roseibium aggregatum TaxID=187304 RepID=A0A939EIW1_9HYPH|nr:DUF6212 domain-containing protein [Roseibium aggregatum]MBN9673834.1 hypothetical protein [Roseibium aggregatum]
MSLAPWQLPAGRKLVLASEQDREALAGSSIEHLVRYLEPGSTGIPVLRNTFPLLAVAFSKESEASLKTILSSIRQLRTVPEVEVLRLEAGKSEKAFELMRALLDGGVGRVASFSASFTAELALLRREREALLENYRALEDAFQARNWEPLAETFVHDPYVDPKDEGIGQLLASGFIDQLLPVSSLGVAGIALHLSSVPKDGGALSVTLSYVESEETVAEWTVDYKNLVTGWNYFSLPRACGGAARTLRLRVSTSGTETIGLSLGYPIASERYTTRSNVEHPDLDLRPLAFRVYTGVPGVAPTLAPNMIAPTSTQGTPRVQNYHLPVDLLKQVIDVSVSSIVPDFETISFLEHEHALVCHPLPSGITAGAISGAVEAGTTSLSANAIIDHPEGAPAAVSFLLAPANTDPRSKVEEIERSEPAFPTAMFSGWREVGPESPISINMQLDEPLGGPMDLMILSRAVGDSVDFSWLKVSGFRIVRQSPAAAGTGDVHVQ